MCISNKKDSWCLSLEASKWVGSKLQLSWLQHHWEFEPSLAYCRFFQLWHSAFSTMSLPTIIVAYHNISKILYNHHCIEFWYINISLGSTKLIDYYSIGIGDLNLMSNPIILRNWVRRWVWESFDSFGELRTFLWRIRTMLLKGKKEFGIRGEQCWRQQNTPLHTASRTYCSYY